MSPSDMKGEERHNADASRPHLPGGKDRILMCRGRAGKENFRMMLKEVISYSELRF